MKRLFSLLIFFIPVLTLAQDTSIAAKYERKTVFLYGRKYMLDGERLPKSSLKGLLYKYPESRLEYLASKKWNTGAKVLDGLAFVFYTLAVSNLITYNNQKFEGWIMASAVTAILRFPIAMQGKKHFDKALWLYNKNALVN